MLFLDCFPIDLLTSELAQQQCGSFWLSLHEHFSVEAAKDQEVKSLANARHAHIAGYRADASSDLKINDG